MRDLEVIASELRLIAAIRRTGTEVGMPAPSIGLADEWLFCDARAWPAAGSYSVGS
jgi:hypothetical protein